MLSFHRPIEVLHGFGFPVWTRVLTADTHGAYTGPPMNKVTRLQSLMNFTLCFVHIYLGVNSRATLATFAYDRNGAVGSGTNSTLFT